MALFDAILGGLLDFGTASQTNKANRENTNAIIASDRANQETALQSLTGGDAFATTTRTPEGGFDVSQLGGADAATARSSLASGDIGRAGNINELTEGFQFQLPTLSDARGVVEGDNALLQSSFDQGLEDIIIQNTRQFGGINNTNQTPAAIDAIARFADAKRFGGERDALDLFSGSRSNDINALLQQLSANQLQVPAPGFSTGGPGNVAANVIAQTPPHDPPIDLSGALPFAAGSSAVAQLQQESADAERNRQFLLALRTIGDQAA